VSELFWKYSFGILAVVGALGAGSVAAQDFTAGKNAAQLFQSDCTACHKSPAGLAKGRDARSLTGFLREHYTTKDESAAILAAYLTGGGLGSVPADSKQKPQTPGAGPKPKPATGAAESEPAGPKPGPKPRATAAIAPEAKPGEADGDSTIMQEESPKPPVRTPSREGTRPSSGQADSVASKLKSYAAAGGDAKETERLTDTTKKLESYASSGAPAEAIAPAAPKNAAAPPAEAGANADAVPSADDANATRKRKGSEKKKKDTTGTPAAASDTTAGATAPRSPRPPHRAQGPATQPVPGNN
jgi:hypothetical protein